MNALKAASLAVLLAGTACVAVSLALPDDATSPAPVDHADNNSACWGDASRRDITCVKITEPLLLGLRGQNMESVRAAMKAPGAERAGGQTLHFVSNYDRGRTIGAGRVNVVFEDGLATIVNASVDPPGGAEDMQFAWNAYATPPLGEEFDRSTKDFARQPFCSDFTGRPTRCMRGGLEYELTFSQVESGLTKADLLRMLESACKLGQGDGRECAAARRRLR